MGLAARILHTITDPNIAYILFSLALIGLAAELYSPGLIFEKISEVARRLDGRTMSLPYLDALKTIGSSPASKFVLPMEVTNFLRSFARDTARAAEGSDHHEPADAEAPAPRH